MNAVLLETRRGRWHIGGWNAGEAGSRIVALVSEAGLLFVAAQAGFVDGPRVMANMAVDSWLPHRFAALSERLSMQNGVLLMGGTSIAALLYTHGDVAKLVVMYSINVFLTFSLSNLGMSRFWITAPEGARGLVPPPAGAPRRPRALRDHPHRHVLREVRATAAGSRSSSPGSSSRSASRSSATTAASSAPSAASTSSSPIRSGPRDAPSAWRPGNGEPVGAIDPRQPVAILFVGGYGGLGRHALLTLLRMFPGHFKGVVFCSIAIIDSGNFKGVDEVHDLEARTRVQLDKYVRSRTTLGLPAESAFSTGIEVAVEAEKLGTELIAQYPQGLFVAGQLLFEEDSTFNRILHNETAFLIQRRLQHAGSRWSCCRSASR